MTDTLSTRIQLILADVARQLAPDADDFVGRQFVRDVVAEFTHTTNRMLVLVGPPGIGKTAMAAQLLRESLAAGEPFLAHFCGRADGADPSEFVRAVALQVQAALGDDYRLPQSLSKQLNISVTQTIASGAGEARVTGVEIKELKLGGVHPREAFRMLVREPLRAYDELRGAERAGKPLVLVIDALDRAWEWDGGQGANIISVLADVQDMPPWVNLLCTARPGPAVQLLRNQAGVRVYDIEPLGAPNLADIRTFLEERLLGRLAAEPRARLLALLGEAGQATAGDDAATLAALAQRLVAASQGNFLFVRRYAAELRAALAPAAGQPHADPAALLRLDDGAASLASALDGSYRAIVTQVRQRLDTNQADADEDVLTALAIAFEPVNVPLLRCLTGRDADAIEGALGRLEPVLARDVGANDITVAFYHRGFADFVRRGLPRGGRDQDVRAARALELADGEDRLVVAYAGRHRWAHLLRGLDLAPIAERPAAQEAQTPAPAVDAGETWQQHVQQVRSMARAPAVQAQLLRSLATQALDPGRSDTSGSWEAAIGYLRASERVLRRSRALLRAERRGGAVLARGAAPPDEHLELERTLVALGDAYTTVARRMDGGVQRTDTSTGLASRLYLLWDSLVRLPLTIYLLVVLLAQGVREIHIPGALQNLGREQDWAVARLLVLAVSAYRRAGSLARARGADGVADEVLERLGRVYLLMGAYDVAAASYEMLLSRPAAITSPWRRSVWLLALGEVLLAQRKPDRAVEALSSALPTFTDQQAPVLLARAYSGLAAAHHMLAAFADARRDDELATRYDDQAIAGAGAGLTAWLDVTNLQGDELAAVDPPLAIGRLANILHRTAAAPRISDEQHRRATAELERIPERHFPQRFEHPLLRLFRIAATVGLPAYVLGALLLAIQAPRDFLVPVSVNLQVQAPRVSLSSFPNNLVSGGGTTPAALSATDLAELVTDSQLTAEVSEERFLPNSLDTLPTVSATALALAAGYLVLYTVAGIVIVALVSPAQLQHQRPGRLVLRRSELVWRGAVSRGALADLGQWLAESATHLLRRRHRPAASDERTLALDDVARTVTVDRRALGFLLGDFSGATVQPRGELPALVIPGTLDFYDELTAVLAERLGARYRSFNMEVVASLSGATFALTIGFAAALAALVPLLPEALDAPLASLGYSLGDLYVLAAPGMALPLVWWFIAQPLGAAHARAAATPRLLATALVGAIATSAVVLGFSGASLLRIEPDLFTPALALAIVASLLVYTPPRPLSSLLQPSLRNVALGGLTLAAAVGVAALCYNLAVTGLWYHHMVQGDAAIEASSGDPSCEDPVELCQPLEQALRHYATMICLRPGNSEGYALFGLASLISGSYDAAGASFAAGRAVGTPQASPTPGCLPTIAAPPSADDAAALHANQGASEVLSALDIAAAEATPEERPLRAQTADDTFSAALRSYASALSRPQLAGDGRPSCYDMARQLLDADPAREIESAAPAGQLRDEDSILVMELAGACYHRALSNAAALDDLPADNRPAVQRLIWDDLAGAAALFRAVYEESGEPEALRSLAAAWLLLGQTPAPETASDQRSYLLRAERSFRELAELSANDGAEVEVDALAGQAWALMLLGATTEAGPPLEQARRATPASPVYPALQGMAAWLDGTRFEPPSKEAASPAYSRALAEALRRYTEAIELSEGDLSLLYATRSTIQWSLRNSPRGERYEDRDYGTWMRLAIADVDQALAQTELYDQPASDQVGYRYWRGRLSFSLGLTWQRRLRGLHTWGELVPLYSRALEDFEAGARDDPNELRREEYVRLWGPWARYMLDNATQMALAEEAAEAGQWDRARRALELVQPRLDPATTRGWDRQSAPQPDYALLHGLVSLALGAPADFVNPLTSSSDPASSYALALKDAGSAAIVPGDVREAFYRRALADLDRLIDSGRLLPQSRAAANEIRGQLRERLPAD